MFPRKRHQMRHLCDLACLLAKQVLSHLSCVLEANTSGQPRFQLGGQPATPVGSAPPDRVSLQLKTGKLQCFRKA